MKKISSVVMASAIALSMLAFGGQDSAKAGPIVPPGHDCIQYDEGGTDCSFTTYRSVRRRLRGWPRSAMAVRFKMISASGGMAGPAVHTG